jgi:hypothetical protein
MSSNAERAAILTRALEAGIRGDRGALSDLYVDDVKAWTPAQSASSAAELFALLERRDDAFSDMDLEVTPLDVGGDYACAEWRVAMTHSGELELRDAVVPPTGLRIIINGVTIAEFRGNRICSLRQYWDEFTVLEQLGVLGGASNS